MTTVQSLVNYTEVGANSCTNFTGIRVVQNGKAKYISAPFNVSKVGDTVNVIGAFGQTASWSNSEFPYANLMKISNEIQASNISSLIKDDFRLIEPRLKGTINNPADGEKVTMQIHFDGQLDDVDRKNLQLWLFRYPRSRRSKRALSHPVHQNGSFYPINGSVINNVNFPSYRKKYYGGKSLDIYDTTDPNNIIHTYKTGVDTEVDVTTGDVFNLTLERQYWFTQDGLKARGFFNNAINQNPSVIIGVGLVKTIEGRPYPFVYGRIKKLRLTNASMMNTNLGTEYLQLAVTEI